LKLKEIEKSKLELKTPDLSKIFQLTKQKNESLFGEVKTDFKNPDISTPNTPKEEKRKKKRKIPTPKKHTTKKNTSKRKSTKRTKMEHKVSWFF
jgi:hypothetical protein